MILRFKFPKVPKTLHFHSFLSFCIGPKKFFLLTLFSRPCLTEPTAQNWTPNQPLSYTSASRHDSQVQVSKSSKNPSFSFISLILYRTKKVFPPDTIFQTLPDRTDGPE